MFECDFYELNHVTATTSLNMFHMYFYEMSAYSSMVAFMTLSEERGTVAWYHGQSKQALREERVRPYV